MTSRGIRTFISLAMAIALIVPPLTGVLLRALGGDGRHVHFDHVWHQDAEIHAHRHAADTAGMDRQHDHDDFHCDHFHTVVMALVATAPFEVRRGPRSYDPAPITIEVGRGLSPPSRPPQRMV
ncbi:MAG: hypothetical protein FJX59_13835 [Alphaproteobacteria bacterium]|nr:hypothetical protein [Alphaproteobacteria bacterium]